MQKQLLDMTDIPVQIQSKIAMVHKALEQFMTMDPDALESSFERAPAEGEESHEELNSEKQFSSYAGENEVGREEADMENEVNNNEANSESFDHFEIEHSTRETSFSLDDLEEQYRKIQSNDESTDVEKSNNDDGDDDEKSICESVKSEEMLRLEEEKRKKNEKIRTLQKSWQKLCSNTKTIHKLVWSCEGCLWNNSFGFHDETQLIV